MKPFSGQNGTIFMPKMDPFSGHKWIHFQAKNESIFEPKINPFSGQHVSIFRPKWIHFRAKIYPFSGQNGSIFGPKMDPFSDLKWIHFRTENGKSVFGSKWNNQFSGQNWKSISGRTLIHLQTKIDQIPGQNCKFPYPNEFFFWPKWIHFRAQNKFISGPKIIKFPGKNI